MQIKLKWRPQILTALLSLLLLGYLGVSNEMNEVATATIGGIIALGMKLLENE